MLLKRFRQAEAALCKEIRETRAGKSGVHIVSRDGHELTFLEAEAHSYCSVMAVGARSELRRHLNAF